MSIEPGDYIKYGDHRHSSTIEQATERVRLAHMAYAEVSADDPGFAPVLVDGEWGITWGYDGEVSVRGRAADIATLAVFGPDKSVYCHQHRSTRALRALCDMVPVGYSLIGGLCWKAGATHADR